MILNVRDAKITDKAVKLILDKKHEMTTNGYPLNTHRGQVINKLLNEYAELLEKQKTK